jgi:FlaG/FlaF family flagellin (archaellin)
MSGIEPIIAVVILVAVTLVIAIGVIGWLMGWWGTIGATEQLILYGDSKLKVSDNNTVNTVTVELHVANKGSAAAVIYKVEVAGAAASKLSDKDNKICSNNQCTLTPGADVTITAEGFTGLTIVPGTSYVVKVYTKAGNTYQITLVAEKSS